jgi:hypothetical protein
MTVWHALCVSTRHSCNAVTNKGEYALKTLGALVAVLAFVQFTSQSAFAVKQFRGTDIPQKLPIYGSAVINDARGKLRKVPNSGHKSCNGVADAKGICKAVSQRVTYIPDRLPKDEWRSAGNTWETGQGDCEDFAVTVAELCKQKNIETTIYVFSSPIDREAHAVVIGRSNGQMWMSSNGSYENVLSVGEARDKTAREQGWWYQRVKERRVTASDICLKTVSAP